MEIVDLLALSAELKLMARTDFTNTVVVRMGRVLLWNKWTSTGPAWH